MLRFSTGDTSELTIFFIIGGMKDKDGGAMCGFGRHAIEPKDFVRKIKFMLGEKDLLKDIEG